MNRTEITPAERGIAAARRDARNIEWCQHCGCHMIADKAIEVAEWLLEETKTFTVDQGPLCSTCARHYRAAHE